MGWGVRQGRSTQGGVSWGFVRRKLPLTLVTCVIVIVIGELSLLHRPTSFYSLLIVFYVKVVTIVVTQKLSTKTFSTIKTKIAIAN